MENSRGTKILEISDPMSIEEARQMAYSKSVVMRAKRRDNMNVFGFSKRGQSTSEIARAVYDTLIESGVLTTYPEVRRVVKDLDERDFEDLVEAVQSGDEDAIAEIVRISGRRRKVALRDKDTGIPIRNDKPEGSLSLQTDVEANYSKENWAEKGEVPYGLDVAATPVPKEAWASEIHSSENDEPKGKSFQRKTAEWNIDQKEFAKWLTEAKGIDQGDWSGLSNEDKINLGKEFQSITQKSSSFSKQSYIRYVPGHKNSKGESAPWCIFDHKTGKLLSSHKTKEKAKKHLQDIYIHKHYALKEDMELPTNANLPENVKLAKGTKLTITKIRPKGIWAKVSNVKFASSEGVKSFNGEVYMTYDETKKLAATDDTSNVHPSSTSDWALPNEDATLQGAPAEVISFLDGKTVSQLRTMVYDLASSSKIPLSFDLWRVKMMDRDELKRIIYQEIANRSGLIVPKSLNYKVPESVKHSSISDDVKKVIEAALQYKVFNRKDPEKDIIREALRDDINDVIEAAVHESDMDKEIPLGEGEVTNDPEVVEKFDWRKKKPTGVDIPEVQEEISKSAGRHIETLREAEFQIAQMKEKAKLIKKKAQEAIKEIELKGGRAEKERKILDETRTLINYLEGSDLAGKVLRYKDLFVTLQEKMDTIEVGPSEGERLNFILEKLHELGGMIETEILEALDEFVKEETHIEKSLEKKLSVWPIPEKYKRSSIKKAQLVTGFHQILTLFNEADQLIQDIEHEVAVL